MILKWNRGNDLGTNIKNYKLPIVAGGELGIEIMIALEYFKSSNSRQV